MTTSSPTSVDLLNLARQGDSESLGLLLRKYFRYLNSLSYGHIDERIRMRVSASDVVQETLLEAHRDFRNFVGTSLEEFTGWLRRILFNNLSRAIEKHVLTAKRDVRKQRSINEDVDNASQGMNPLAGLLAADVSNASSAMHRNESLLQLQFAIDRLPKDYREVIHLRHFEGLSFPEIALRLNRNSGAIRMLWVRAVEKLKHNLPKSD